MTNVKYDVIINMWCRSRKFEVIEKIYLYYVFISQGRMIENNTFQMAI